VYRFCLFRRREDPNSFVPDPTQFPAAVPRPLPYIFSEADILRLLATADELTAHQGSPLQREVARAAIVILCTTGLRRGELVRLTLGDYDETTQVFHVRQTKFDKSRLVPLSADTALELQRYLNARRQFGAPRDADAPLLVHNHGGRFRSYTGGGFGELLRKVIRTAGIRTTRDRAPRIHDLRFTFAVRALLRWYRDGVDVQARLPALATYLGHVSVVSTQYYLIFLEATAVAASERFHAHSASWLTPGEGGRR
jgi:integrase